MEGSKEGRKGNMEGLKRIRGRMKRKIKKRRTKAGGKEKDLRRKEKKKTSAGKNRLNMQKGEK